MNNVVLISTHIIGESVFPKDDFVYSEKLSEYFRDKYDLKKEYSGALEPKTPKELFKSSERFFDQEKDGANLSDWSGQLLDGDNISLIKSMKKGLEDKVPNGIPSPEITEIIKDMDYYLEYYEKKKNEIAPIFSEEEAKGKTLSAPEPSNRTLLDVSSLYKYHPDNSDGKDSEYAVYSVMELKTPDYKDDKGVWKWVKALEEAIREQHKEVNRIILLLHDQDLKEYCGLKFQCVEYEENGVSIAIFQHSDLEVLPLFSGKLSSQQVFEELDGMISVMSKMRECNDNNEVAKGYDEFIEKQK